MEKKSDHIRCIPIIHLYIPFVILTFYLLFLFTSSIPFYEGVRRLMAALHSARSPATVSNTSAACKSPFTHFIHDFLGLPLGQRPGASTSFTLLNGSSSSHLYTCPNHAILLLRTPTKLFSKPILLNISTLATRSRSDSPHIRLIILL